jgi:hypothetical protein
MARCVAIRTKSERKPDNKDRNATHGMPTDC